MVFGHIVQDDHPILGLMCIHFFEIDFFNRKENFGTNLTNSCPLSRDWLIVSVFGSVFEGFNALSFNMKLNGLNFFVEIEHMYIDNKFVFLLDERFI